MALHPDLMKPLVTEAGRATTFTHGSQPRDAMGCHGSRDAASAEDWLCQRRSVQLLPPETPEEVLQQSWSGYHSGIIVVKVNPHKA